MALRPYVFFCENCNYEFEEYIDWADIAGYKPACNMCRTNKDVYRQFGAEKIMARDNNPRTVGALADKNAKNKGIQLD